MGCPIRLGLQPKVAFFFLLLPDGRRNRGYNLSSSLQPARTHERVGEGAQELRLCLCARDGRHRDVPGPRHAEGTCGWGGANLCSVRVAEAPACLCLSPRARTGTPQPCPGGQRHCCAPAILGRTINKSPTIKSLIASPGPGAQRTNYVKVESTHAAVADWEFGRVEKRSRATPGGAGLVVAGWLAGSLARSRPVHGARASWGDNARSPGYRWGFWVGGLVAAGGRPSRI